ncbi:MAG: translocation/assembly module TamB domain-containing protein [Myxococcota bacterium]
MADAPQPAPGAEPDDQSPPPKRRRWWRRIMWSILGLVLLVLLAVPSAILVLQTDWGRAKALEVALSAVNAGIRGTLHVERIEGPVIRRISFVGVTVDDPDGQQALSLARLDLEYRLWPLIQKQVEIHSLKLEKPEAEILDSQGRVRLARAFAAKNPAPPTPEDEATDALDWTIVLDRIAVADARIAQSAAEGSIALTDLTVKASIALDGQGLRWDEVRITGAAEGLPVDRVELVASGALKGDSLVFDRLNVVGGPHELDLRGGIDRLDAPILALTVDRAHVELEPLGGLLGRDDLQGTIDGTGAVAGPLSHLALALDFVSPGGAISVRASGDVLATDPSWIVAVAARKLQPQKLAPQFEWPLNISFDVSGRGHGDPTTTGEAYANIHLRQLSGIDFVPTPIRLSASAVEGALALDMAADDAQDGHLSLSVRAPHLPPGPISAEVDLSNLDIEAWTRLFDIDGLAGQVESLRLEASVELGEGFDISALQRAKGTLSLVAHDLEVPESLGVAAKLGDVSVATNLDWPGEGLPTGDLTLHLADAAALDIALRTGDLTARFEPEDGGVRARGDFSANDLRQGDAIGLSRASAPFDVFMAEDGTLRASANLEAAGVRAPGVAVKGATAKLEASMTDTTLTASGPVSVRGLALQAGPSVGSAKGTIAATVPLDHPEHLSATVDLEVAALRVDAETSVAGARIQGAVTLGKGLPTVNATVGARDIKAAGIRLDKARLEARFSPRSGGVLDLTAEGEDAQVEVGVSVDSIAKGKPIEAKLRSLKLQRGAHGFEAQPGAVVRYVQKTGAFSVTGLSVHDIAEPRAVLVIGGLVEPTRGAVAASVTAEKVPLAAWLASLRGFGIDPFADIDVSGDLTLRGSIKGTLRDPTVALKASLTEAQVGPIEALELTLDARIAEDGTKGTVDAKWNGDRAISLSLLSAARVTFDGPPAITPQTPFAADIQIARVVLDDFAPWLEGGGEDAPTGVLTGSAVVGGTLGQPVAAVDIDLADVVYGPIADGSAHLGVILGASGSKLDIRLVDEGVERVLLLASVPSNLAELAVQPGATGSLLERLEREPLALELRIAKTRLSDLPFTGELGDLQRAQFVAAVDISGTLGDPAIGGQIRVDDIHIGGGAASVGLDLATRDSDLEITAAIAGNSGEALRVEGLLPSFGPRLISGAPVAAFIDDERTSLRLSSAAPVDTITDISPEIGRILDGAIPGVELKLELVVSGGPQAEARLILHAEAARSPDAPVATSDQPAASAVAATLASAVRVDVRVRRHTTLASFSVEQAANDGRLFVEASAPLGVIDLLDGVDLESVDLSGSVGTSQFSLAGLRGALPGVFGTTRGHLDADVVVAGTIGAPKLDGRMLAHFDQVLLAPIGLEAEDLDLALRLTPERLIIEPIHLERDGGTMDLRLAVETPGLDTSVWVLDGALSLRRFRALTRREVKLRATGDVTVAGTLDSPLISGQLTVNDGTIDPLLGGREVHSTDMPDDVVFVSAGDIGVSVEELSAAAKIRPVRTGGARIDATVIVPKRTLFVKNDMFDLELAGRVHAKIRGEEVALEGVITVERGKVKVLGREFEISQDSRVVFDGSPDLDPILDVTATYDISGVDLSPLGLTATDASRIYVRVTGRATAPELKLSANPGMDETNIVSIITVGHPVGGGGEGQAVRGQLLTAVVGLALGPATKFITDKLPIDILEVQVGDDAALSDARITAGTRIRRDLFILYDADLGADENENVHELRIVYAMKRGLKIETYFGDAGKGGIELLLRRTF